jgi:hypothetical protein
MRAGCGRLERGGAGGARGLRPVVRRRLDRDPVPGDFVRSLLPFILLAVAVYTFRKKDLGAVHAPVHSGMTERWWRSASAPPSVSMTASSVRAPAAS